MLLPWETYITMLQADVEHDYLISSNCADFVRLPMKTTKNCAQNVGFSANSDD